MAQLQPQTCRRQCGSKVSLTINAPIHAVWSVIRRFDQPQVYRKMIKSCALVLGSGEVGSTRLVGFRTGLSGTTSLDRLQMMDEDRHVMVYKVIGGDQKLLNFELTTSLQEVVRHGNEKSTLVTESYTVDVPEDSNEDDTCFFANTVIQFNLRNLAYVAENMACVSRLI
ncbi:hypothetical protein Cgig2_028824 [Carnegiea gigantea]|uniref:Uncharacterized protein n=1 Tax=Carnegiea gigantea TaxID=171969 RepID=A0A9Q1KS96_9CARY|nr:hypothetical protein Cgig2_028824 [Carnegiea gigantea]